MLALYTRISRQDDESNSINNQLREGKEFSINHNLKYKHYDEGEGISGGNDIEDRPILKQLIKDIISKEITTVWFRNQQRLERSSLTYNIFISYCKINNVSIYYGDKLFDITNSKEVFLGQIISAMNQMQIEAQSEATIKSLLDNAKEGKYHGITPYGYTKDLNKVVVVDEEEAKIVKRIYQMSLNGTGTRTIAYILNKENIQTRYNKIGEGTLTTTNKYTNKKTTTNKKDINWSGNTIRNIIKNTIYKGEKKYRDNIYQITPILSPEYWKKVNDNLVNNRNNSGKKVEYRYLLKGLLRCGRCGRNYYGKSRENKKDHYYMCSSKRIKNHNCGNRSINIDFIENLIWNDLFKHNKLKELIINHLNNTDEKVLINNLNTKITKQNTINKELHKQKERITELLIKNIIEENEAVKHRNKIDKELQQLNIELTHNIKELEFYTNKTLSTKEITSNLNNITNNISFTNKQNIINDHIKNITINYIDINKTFIINIELNHLILNQNYITTWNYKTTTATNKPITEFLRTNQNGINRSEQIEWLKDNFNITPLIN